MTSYVLRNDLPAFLDFFPSDSDFTSYLLFDRVEHRLSSSSFTFHVSFMTQIKISREANYDVI